MWRVWACALLWGLNWPAVKISLGGISPFALRAIGLGCGALIVMTFARLMGRRLAVPRSEWSAVLIAGLLTVAGFNLSTVFAQLTMPTSRAAILTFTMPLWAAIFGVLFAGEKIDRLRAVTLAIGTAGLVILSVPFWPVLAAGGIPIGLVYVMTAAMTWAGGTVFTKVRKLSGDPMALTAWQLLVGAAAGLIGLIAWETPRVDLSVPGVAVALTYHVVLATALAYWLWFGLLDRVASGTAAIGTLLIPIFGVAGAVVILGERPTTLDMGGFALLLVSVAVDQILRSRRAPAVA